MPVRAGGEGFPGRLGDIQYAIDQSAIVAATDVAGSITYVNQKFCEISGYSREELLGATHRIINSGHHPAEFFREMYRTVGQGRTWRSEIRNRAKNGSIYWVDTTIVPFLDAAGKPYQYISIRYDITDRKRSQIQLEEQAGLVQVGRLASMVAHEVRNPLAGIRGAMQVLSRRMTEGTRELDVVREVIARIDTLNEIVGDLLHFAQPRPLALGEIRIGEIVGSLGTLIGDDPRFRGVELRTDLHDDVLVADPGQLKLAILNLLLNAAQAMPGGGEIRVRTVASEGWLEIHVEDEGPGIPAVNRERLFEPFFTTKTRGTGLGLPTTRRIIERHGGTVQIDSPPAGGTIVKMRVPRRGPAERERHAPAAGPR
jgi:PAS domain S-box-containing protein